MAGTAVSAAVSSTNPGRRMLGSTIDAASKQGHHKHGKPTSVGGIAHHHHNHHHNSHTHNSKPTHITAKIEMNAKKPTSMNKSAHKITQTKPLEPTQMFSPPATAQRVAISLARASPVARPRFPPPSKKPAVKRHRGRAPKRPPPSPRPRTPLRPLPKMMPPPSKLPTAASKLPPSVPPPLLSPPPPAITPSVGTSLPSQPPPNPPSGNAPSYVASCIDPTATQFSVQLSSAGNGVVAFNSADVDPASLWIAVNGRLLLQVCGSTAPRNPLSLYLNYGVFRINVGWIPPTL